MVSLGEGNHRQGGYFQFENSLDQSLRTQTPTEEVLDTTLGADVDPGFRKIHTPFAIVFLMFLVICMEIGVWLVPHYCIAKTTCGISAYSIVIYSHATLWFITMLLDRYLRRLHYISRTNGYLEFYRKTRNIRRMPLMIYSGGLAMLTILMVILYDYCNSDSSNLATNDDKYNCPGLSLSGTNYLQILVTLETIIILPILITYLVWTVQFNRSHASPDVHQDDMLHTFMHTTPANADVGFRDENYLDDVMEKQADLIRYLKQHNSHLGKKILNLTAQVNSLKNGSVSRE